MKDISVVLVFTVMIYLNTVGKVSDNFKNGFNLKKGGKLTEPEKIASESSGRLTADGQTYICFI